MIDRPIGLGTHKCQASGDAFTDRQERFSTYEEVRDGRHAEEPAENGADDGDDQPVDHPVADRHCSLMCAAFCERRVRGMSLCLAVLLKKESGKGLRQPKHCQPRACQRKIDNIHSNGAACENDGPCETLFQSARRAGIASQFEKGARGEERIQCSHKDKKKAAIPLSKIESGGC